MKNSKSERSNTGYKGITFSKQKGRFQAQVVSFNNKPVHKFIHLNPETKCFQTTIWARSYDTLKEAIIAREEFIKSLF